MFRIILYTLTFLLSALLFAIVRSQRVRQVYLLVASYILYCSWSFWFAPVLLVSTAMNFLLGQSLRRNPTRRVLVLGLVLNLSLLGVFKYLPPVAVHLPFSSLRGLAYLALPLGISFWTFQAMSYLFDLYRGEELDASFVEFALYMAFFPVTISGPICRMPDMLPQFRSVKLTRLVEFGRGFARIATGILMMQLARLLGQGILSGDGIVRGFDQATRWSGADAWCLAFGYGLQLFFDFAGYSHIAIGAAQALGFTLPENFDRPFASTTPSIFWTRWHMSLSFWIRDYLFFPLATMRREIWWRNLVLAFSMIAFGVWHQATLLFVLWGCYHGLLLVVHRQIQQVQRKFAWDPPAVFWTPLSWLVTFCLINLGWIFFRANSLAQATEMLLAVFSGSYSLHFLSGSLYALVSALGAGYVAVLFADHFMNRAIAPQQLDPVESRPEIIARLARFRWYWIPALYILALIVVLLVTHSREAGAAQFMYRRF